MDKIKTVKIKNPDGSISEESYSISVDAINVDMSNGKELQETIGTIDIDTDGNIAEQLENLNDNVDVLNIDIKKKAYFFDTIADMKNANLKVGDYICTLGYYEANDGGGAEYRIVSGTYTDDGGSYHQLDSNLYAELIIRKNTVDPKQFGAYGDGEHDDAPALQKAINKAHILMNKGTYLLNSTVVIGANKIFDGNRCTLKPVEDIYALSIFGNTFANVKTEIQIKNVNIDCNLHGNGIYMKDTYFIYLDDINIYGLSKNGAIGIKILNGFNHTIKNSRMLGKGDFNYDVTGIDITTDSASMGLANMTNNKYDTILLQNLQYGIKAQWTDTANLIEFNNLGFSNNDYCYYLDGHADPVIINNSRMESGSRKHTDGKQLVGFYLGQGISATIDSLNAYQIDKVIVSESTRNLVIKGAISLTGTKPSDQTDKFLFIAKTNSTIDLLGSFYVWGNDWNVSSSSTQIADGCMINAINAIRSIKEITSGNQIQMGVTECNIYKTSVSILNIWGPKGSRGYIYTENANGSIVIWGSPNSLTNLWTGAITLEPYKLYECVALENNKFAIII